MKKTLFMLFCLLCSIGAMAQKKTITGVVTDATGEAVIGASIVEYRHHEWYSYRLRW